jgi:hypothetical protein
MFAYMRVYVCMCMCVCVRMCGTWDYNVCMYVYACLRMCVCMYVCMCACHVCSCMYVCINLCMYLLCVYICMYIYIHVCMCTHIRMGVKQNGRYCLPHKHLSMKIEENRRNSTEIIPEFLSSNKRKIMNIKKKRTHKPNTQEKIRQKLHMD